MKRFGLMSFAALALAGASSALTVNWDAALMGNNLYGGYMGVAIVVGNIKTQFTYSDILSPKQTSATATTATWTSSSGTSNTFIGFAQMGNDSSSISASERYGRLDSGSANSYGYLWDKNPTDKTPRAVYRGTFELDNPAEGFALVLFNAWNESYAVYNYQLWDTVLEELELTLDLGTIGWLTSDKTAIHDPVTIPEPTALALLALGVAGLALRRRVA